MVERLDSWLERLGYADEPQRLHRHVEDVPENHAYAREIKALLRPDGDIRARRRVRCGRRAFGSIPCG